MYLAALFLAWLTWNNLNVVSFASGNFKNGYLGKCTYIIFRQERNTHASQEIMYVCTYYEFLTDESFYLATFRYKRGRGSLRESHQAKVWR